MGKNVRLLREKNRWKNLFCVLLTFPFLFFLHHLLASETFSFFIADMKNGIAQWVGEEEMHYRKINNRHVCNFLSFLIAVTHEILEKKVWIASEKEKKDKLKIYKQFMECGFAISMFTAFRFNALSFQPSLFFFTPMDELILLRMKKSIYCVVVLWGTQTNLIYVIEYGDGLLKMYST